MEYLLTLLMWLVGLFTASPAAAPVVDKSLISAPMPVSSVPVVPPREVCRQERRLDTRTIIIFEDTHFRHSGN
jgi:hypothetical protein